MSRRWQLAAGACAIAVAIVLVVLSPTVGAIYIVSLVVNNVIVIAFGLVALVKAWLARDIRAALQITERRGFWPAFWISGFFWLVNTLAPLGVILTGSVAAGVVAFLVAGVWNVPGLLGRVWLIRAAA